MNDPHDPRVPFTSLIFGYGPMLPLVAAAFAAWLAPPSLADLALRLALIWGALILAFVAGVRRGYGFDRPEASEVAQIATMIPYVVLAGAALILGVRPLAFLLLALGYLIALVLDTWAARRGDAPAHFARLRPTQFGLAAVSLLVLALAPNG